MRRFGRYLMIGAGTALMIYFVWFAARSLDLRLLAEALSSPPRILAVIAASLIYASIIPVSAWAWRQLLEVQGETWRVFALARFMALAQLAKYIPGNIAQHATRAVLAMRAGMGTRAYVATVGQETLMAVAASLAVGLFALALSESGLSRISPELLPVLMVCAFGFGISILILASMRLSPDRYAGSTNLLLAMLGRLGGLPGPCVTVSALAAYVFNYLVIGFGLWLVSISVELPTGLDFALVTAAFALSWVMGFLAPGAPAGLGAREGIMLLLLNGSAPPQVLLIFVLLARLVTMLGDGICFVFASCLPMRRGKIGKS